MEKEVKFHSDKYQLAGTLATPDTGNRAPGVLLIPGSGQVDRNENHKKLPLNVFHDLSEFLSKNGYASLRYDKRGVGASEGNFWETGLYDNAADALAALECLKQQEEIDAQKTFLLGHSEGAFLSVHIAAGGADISGIILLAGGARPGEEILKWQAIKVIEGTKGFRKWLINLLRLDISKMQQKQLDKIKRSTKDYYRVQLIAKFNAKWTREFMAYNPADDLPRVTVPVLAITGSKDIQVNPEDLKIMEKLVKSPFEYHILPNVTHLLRTDEGEASIAHYKELVKRPIDERIPRLVRDWLNQQTGKTSIK